MNEILLAFLDGRLDAECFVAKLMSDDDLKNAVRALIPEEAKGNSRHLFWTRISYSALKNRSFDYVQYLLDMCTFSGTISDNYNLFHSIKNTFEFIRPDFPFTKAYDDRFDLYLDITQDCFDGPEVHGVVEQIIAESLWIRPKAARKKTAREKIKETFQTKGKKPRWIQGAEWPMGKQRPMEFEGQEQKSESVQYFFRDVDTGEKRVIEQFC